MGVVSIVVSCLNYLYIILGNLRFLGEFLAQEVGYKIEVAVEEPAHYTESKHVAALQHRLVVHTTVSQAILYHSCQRALHYAIRVDTHLAKIILTLELCFFQVLWSETVGIDNDSGLGL